MPYALLAACSNDSTTNPGKPDGGDTSPSTGGATATTGGSGGASGKPGSGGSNTSGDGGATGGTTGSDHPDASGTGGAPASGSGGQTSDIDGGAEDGGHVAFPTTPIVTAVSKTGPDRFYGVTTDADGNVFAVGQIADSNDTTADFSMLLAKFTKEGALDESFGDRGIVIRNVIAGGTNGELYRGVAVQSTGKIIVSGQAEHAGAADARDRDLVVLRFNADGTKDTDFGTDGIVTLDLSTGVVSGSAFAADSAWGLALYDDDRIVVSGGEVRNGATDTDFVLVRLKADGTRDDSFADNGVFALDTQIGGMSNNASPRNVTILPGKQGVIGAGYQPIPGADTGPVVYKVDDTGKLDTTFGTDGVFSDRPLTEQTETYMAAIQPDATGTGYSLVTTGYGRELDTETTDIVSLRLTSDGKLDTTYGTNGVARVDIGGFGDNSRRLVVLPDRRVLLVGGGRSTSADVDGTFVLLTADGKPDTTFAPKGFKTVDLGGPADFLWSVALMPDKTTAVAAGIMGVGTSPTPP
ncbi:MAG TPA: hypothetical protein VHC69_25270, partial [Polyangiaceae bacterium]|nr:hypothetical protein [Polyangiaceae bacterium]